MLPCLNASLQASSEFRGFLTLPLDLLQVQSKINRLGLLALLNVFIGRRVIGSDPLNVAGCLCAVGRTVDELII